VAKTLRDLLAVIHRDGGHHTDEVGLSRSFEDAVTEVYRLRGLVRPPSSMEEHRRLPEKDKLRLIKQNRAKSPRCEGGDGHVMA
jgi:hypothetical protein